MPDDIYVYEDDGGNSKHEWLKSRIPIQSSRYSPATYGKEEIQYDIVAISVVIFNKLSEFPCSYSQIRTYFSREEKKPAHLLNMDHFLKETQEREFEFVVTPRISYSN